MEGSRPSKHFYYEAFSLPERLRNGSRYKTQVNMRHFWPPGSLRRSSGAFLGPSGTPGRPQKGPRGQQERGPGAPAGPPRRPESASIGPRIKQNLFESVSIGRRKPRISQEATGGRQDAARRPPEAQNRQGVLQHRPAGRHEPDSASIGQNLLTAGGPQEPRSCQNQSESAPRSQEASRQESEAIVGQNRSAGNKNK